MMRWQVTVCTMTGSVSYSAIARSSWDLVDHALELFNLCSVSVRQI